MYYILDEKYALRSWEYIPWGAYIKGHEHACGFNEEQYNILLKCDGKTAIEQSDVVKQLEKDKIIHQCVYKEKSLNTWQKHKKFNNRYVPGINLQITGKCNYNCKHCFNCKDNNHLQSEYSFKEINNLLDQCMNCGISHFCITGGEPLMHPNFKEIIKGIYERGMFVSELNTNGFYITREVLEFFKEIGCIAQLKISFDTIKYHGWMRGRKGASETTLDVIKLCVEYGFDVRIQMNVNKKNMDNVLESLLLLDKIGAQTTRLILTMDSPRWYKHHKQLGLSIANYYDWCIELIEQYAQNTHKMQLEIWGFANYHPKNNIIFIQHEKYDSKNKLNLDSPVCRKVRGMPGICANGEIHPCLQMSGFFDSIGLSFGNVKTNGLQALLQDNTCIMKQICLTKKDLINSCKECKECQYLDICGGGYPCMAIATNSRKYSDYLNADRTKCILFKQGYYEKINDLKDSLSKGAKGKY